jgi:ABC-type nitrate/sulfonate/bicarbonate transport system substrate-binding protein
MSTREMDNNPQLARPEKPEITVGIIPLTDCAPLVIAKEKNIFNKYGLNVSLSREVSWANIRDKLAIGALDAAQMLAPMPIASTLGIEAVRKPTVTAFTMDLNGNAITISNALYDEICRLEPGAISQGPVTADILKKVIAQRGADKPLTFAMVFPVSTHNYQIRYWLAAAGIDPDRDVRLTVIPPVHMVANLEAGLIDGYCVGEPWNSMAVAKGIGRTLITSYDIWNNCPEKVLGVNQSWADEYPATHLALVVSLLESAMWIDQPENREEVTNILSASDYLDVPVDILRMSMTGTYQYAHEEPPVTATDFNVFYRYAANFPWPSHAQWFISQMIRWGQLTKPVDTIQAAREIYRTDIFRQACDFLSLPVPDEDTKQEGVHAENWQLAAGDEHIVMGSDRFIDGRVFDPANLVDYLDGFAVHRMNISAKEYFSR